jgi:LuxR family maltose regulon positive regulatory protein
MAGLAHRELGDQRAANQATERALSLAEADRLVLPFAMTSARNLLEALPPNDSGHVGFRTDILGVLPGSSPSARHPYPAPPGEQLSPSELRVLPADQPAPAADRRQTFRLAEHRRHPRPQHLRQAPGPRPFRRRTARPELRLLAAGRTQSPAIT